MQRQLRPLATAAGAVVITGIIATTAYWAGTTSTPETPARTPAAPAPAPPPPRPPEVEMPPSTPAATPKSAALAWLSATNTLSWRDPAPHAWVDRAEPYLTGEAARAAGQARTGSIGADWQRLVADRCIQRVAEPGSVIPPEAPRTDTIVYVQVSGSIVQQCATGTTPAPQPLAATLEVSRTAEGTWRVSKQLF